VLAENRFPVSGKHHAWPDGVANMKKILNLWRNAPKRLPATPLKAVLQIADRKDPKPVSVLSRARAADTDGRARRRKQLVEDNRLH
jgi:hypothetical protein